MPAPSLDLSAPPTMARRLLALTCIACWVFAAGRIVALPTTTLATNVLFDDALYFALPARHWWQGAGFSFDGLEATNGVQALWALVALGLAGLIDDPESLLRGMVVASATCWGLASVMLTRWLRTCGWSAASALFAGVGLAASGTHQSNAFHGMENGLHALLGVQVLRAGTRLAADGANAANALRLGLALALFALNRTEGVLLGLLVGMAMLGGWIGGGADLSGRLRHVALVALPGLVLVGGNAVFNRIAFDCWLPVSGSVKMLYEQQWGGVAARGGAVDSVLQHVHMMRGLALTPLCEQVPADLADLTHLRLRVCRNLVWATLALGGLATVWRWVRDRSATAAIRLPATRIAIAFAAYGAVHLVVMAITLPHFTGYGVWYFASEITIVWLALAMSLRGSAWIPALLALLMSLSIVWHGPHVEYDVRTNRLRGGGRWLAANAPDGAVVGALSSGLTGWYAPRQHVVNLDGLINNRRYLDDVLRRGRLAEYFTEKNITWFADYQPVASWRGGLQWLGTIPAERMVPRQYQRVGDRDAYAIWQILPPGDSFELLGVRTDLVRDRFAELAVAADVHARFPVVAAADLAAALRERPAHVVARSLLDEQSGTLWHVLAPADELPRIGMDDATVHPEHRDDHAVTSGTRLLGHDVFTRPMGEGQLLAVTLFWSCHGPATADDAGDWHLALTRTDVTPLAQEPVAHCHGTLPLARWPVGQVVPETVVLRVATAGDLANARLLLQRAGDGRTFALTR